MLRRLLPLLLLPLTACAFTESDPSKIPDPVKPAASGPREVALSSSEPEPPMTTPYAGHSGRASEEGAGATHAARTPLLLSRVGGDLDARIEIRDGEYRFGPSRIESPLPAGYPEPTPPGAIDVKRYPPGPARRVRLRGLARPRHEPGLLPAVQPHPAPGHRHDEPGRDGLPATSSTPPPASRSRRIPCRGR
jgi:hypothetical protein